MLLNFLERYKMFRFQNVHRSFSCFDLFNFNLGFILSNTVFKPNLLCLFLGDSVICLFLNVLIILNGLKYVFFFFLMVLYFQCLPFMNFLLDYANYIDHKQ